MYYSLDDYNIKAVSNRGIIIYNVMIGNDKIMYYINKKKKLLKFYFFDGFYDIDNKQKFIK